MEGLSYSEELKVENTRRQRAMLHEHLIDEVKEQTELVASGQRKIADLDAEAQKLLRIDELVPSIGPEVYTTGATTSMGIGVPLGRVRDLVMVAVSQGLDFLGRKKVKAESEIKRAADRLAVLRAELTETFGDA